MCWNILYIWYNEWVLLYNYKICVEAKDGCYFKQGTFVEYVRFLNRAADLIEVWACFACRTVWVFPYKLFTDLICWKKLCFFQVFYCSVLDTPGDVSMNMCRLYTIFIRRRANWQSKTKLGLDLRVMIIA